MNRVHQRFTHEAVGLDIEGLKRQYTLQMTISMAPRLFEKDGMFNTRGPRFRLGRRLRRA